MVRWNGKAIYRALEPELKVSRTTVLKTATRCYLLNPSLLMRLV